MERELALSNQKVSRDFGSFLGLTHCPSLCGAKRWIGISVIMGQAFATFPAGMRCRTGIAPGFDLARFAVAKRLRCRIWLRSRSASPVITISDQANRRISTGQLNALLRLHLRPIDVVVYHGPQGYLVLRGASRLDAFSGYPVRS